MPFVSKAQQGYMNANRQKMEGQGVDVSEWNNASKGKSLPGRAPSQELDKGAARLAPMPPMPPPRTKRKTLGQRIGEKD
jgi:hypothetical protein